MSRNSDYNLIIQRGRKAGLNTRELYSALNTRAEGNGEPQVTEADCNGYAVGFDADGHRIFEPIKKRPAK
jgi:hypothetical protein